MFFMQLGIASLPKLKTNIQQCEIGVFISQSEAG
jgi:hypothetical protein